MEYMRTKTTTTKFVIIAMRDGRLKFVSRYYNPKRDYGYTIKVKDSMVFNHKEAAEKAMERFGITGQIGRIEIHTELKEVL